jgi:succinate dehydrogenase/fumarate reductase cytochrome b subunit
MDEEQEIAISPLRLLVKNYSNGLLARSQYLEIRSQVLKKIALQGNITHEEVNNFMKIFQDTGEVSVNKKYSSSDWVIIILGLLAAIALAFILYG